MKKRVITCLLACCMICISAVSVTNPAYAASSAGRYPAAYPAGGIAEIQEKYPPTRNQQSYGSCWAHAAAACADFDMVKNHGHSTAFNVSELQLAYFTYHTAQDRIGYLDGDQNQRAEEAKYHFLTMGGNALYAMRTLAQWKGFTYERNIPYASAKEVISNGLDKANAQRNDAAKLKKGYIIDMENRPEDAKQAIMKYGAVIINYEYKKDHYNSDTNGYRNPYDNVTNHANVIVGWDDHYPADSFSDSATCDGAWLVRNSKTKKNTASNLGYFWMSYEDASLAETAYVMDFMPATQYDHNYQHDGAVSVGAIKAASAANVFTARNLNSTASESLDAVMISFDGEEDVKYQIDIYTALTDSKDPESGYHHSYAVTKGTLRHAGIYTIPLKKKVYLSPGETFSIVVKSRNGRKMFDCEKSVNRTYEDGTGRFKGVAHADPGESFYKRKLTDKKWKDCGKDNLKKYGNMCIKALTNDSGVEKYSISYRLNGGSKNMNPTFYFSTTKETLLQPPERKGYRFLGWYTDRGFCDSIATIQGALGRNLKLYAKWKKEK